MCQSSEEWFTTRGLAVNWCFTRLEKNSTEKDEGVGVDNSFTGQWRYCVAQTEHTLAHLASAHAPAGSELLYCGGRGRVCCCVRARHKHRHRELGESRDGDGITLLCSLSLDSRMMTMCPGPGQETRVKGQFNRRHMAKAWACWNVIVSIGLNLWKHEGGIVSIYLEDMKTVPPSRDLARQMDHWGQAQARHSPKVKMETKNMNCNPGPRPGCRQATPGAAVQPGLCKSKQTILSRLVPPRPSVRSPSLKWCPRTRGERLAVSCIFQNRLKRKLRLSMLNCRA